MIKTYLSFPSSSINVLNITPEETKPNQVGRECTHPKWSMSSRPGSQEGCYSGCSSTYTNSHVEKDDLPQIYENREFFFFSLTWSSDFTSGLKQGML